MGTKTTELLAKLDECISLMNQINPEEPWKRWLEKGRERIAASDYSGIEFLFDGFGGMGSFNDFMFQRKNADGSYYLYPEENGRFNDLRGDIYSLANYIRRNHETN